MTTTMKSLSHWHTWREIHAQPDIWRDWAQALDLGDLRNWIAQQDVEEVWFCGAGTSAYIGDILAAAARPTHRPRLRAVPSTDLVARPQVFLKYAKPALVVNFGRSGNSAETIGTLDALDALAPNWPRLNITCNRDGALAQRGPGRVITLPDACHDQGFAMTSSFTTMLLTAVLAFDLAAPDEVSDLTQQGHNILTALHPMPNPPDRAVFLGSGPLAFAARESALKVMELSAGSIPALWDSTLGFRHGPKSFVTESTAIWVAISSDPHAARYDNDLVAELRSQFPATSVSTIGPGGDIPVDWAHDASAAMLAVLPAQVLGVAWSAQLGLDVDDPFTGRGTLTRVVADVRLHKVAS